MKTLCLTLVAFSLWMTGCRSSILDDPSLTFPYSVAEPSHVTVTIENSYNTVVATLVDADQQPGLYHVSFDAGGFQEGIYFYTVECTGLGITSTYHVKSTNKILIVK